MAGHVSPESARRSKYIPKGHPISWWMLVVTTGAILITSIDRALLPTVLPGILKEFSLSETAGGVLVGLSFAGTMAGGLVLGVFGDSLGKGVRRAYTWAVAVAIVVISALTLGLMIGIGLGSAGFLAAPVAGFIVQHYGFTWHYIFLAVICLLTLVPISMIRETSAGQEESAAPQGA
jgi:hypothetical protein